jgi:cytochrome c biogenesis protein CcdA/thiol-disulfide isomerase/thioredoxin
MLLLVAFSIVAGAGTALTPCVLPVLPGLLSAAGTGGRRRPLGVIVGLAGTHTLAIVALATVIDGVGLPSGAARTLSVVVLAGFGLLLLLPEAAARVEALLSRLVRVAPRSAGSGFWSGIVVGGGLGFVYAPCAGPILAAVVSVSATQGASGRLVAVALGYAAGSAAVLLAIAYGGRRVIDTLRRRGRGPAVQRSLGAVMLITAVAVGANLDVRFQTLLANHVPTFLTNPTHALERSAAVEDRLAGLRGRSRFDSASAGTAARASKALSDGSSLPVLGRAPDFRDNERWFNTPGGRPLTLRGLRGRVVLVDFWTYTCINCIRTLPALRAWDDRYRRAGLTIAGVHTPEFPFERDPRNVSDAIAQNRLRYPVAQDNAYATWNAWGNQYWPAKYLIDGQGRVRYTHFGEGDYDVTEHAIRSLLKEAGAHSLGRSADAHPEVPATGLATPETYLGTKRAQGWAGKPPTPGSGSYPVVTDLPDRAFALGGGWRVSGESATALHAARVDADFTAQKVFLVLSSAGSRPRSVLIFLDGRPVPSGEAGEDVHGGTLTVRRQRLYRLVSLPRSQRRRLTLRFAPGVSGFAFTFG